MPKNSVAENVLGTIGQPKCPEQEVLAADFLVIRHSMLDDPVDPSNLEKL